MLFYLDLKRIKLKIISEQSEKKLIKMREQINK